MAALNMPSIEHIRQYLSYNSDTGLFVWNERTPECFEQRSNRTTHHQCKVWNARFSSKPAFTSNHIRGYLAGQIDNIKMLAHRVAFAHYYGFIPKEIDHINGNRKDNRISNLRDVMHIINCRNVGRIRSGKSGKVGVQRIGHRWSVMISGQYIGTYDTFAQACDVRQQAERRLNFTERHGQLPLLSPTKPASLELP